MLAQTERRLEGERAIPDRSPIVDLPTCPASSRSYAWPLAIAGLIGAQSNTPTWGAILFAVLGSSALGAIFGGYVTTRMRGRLEREEAWRTRLIEAADNLNGGLVRALRPLGNLLANASRGELPLRSKDGTLTEHTAAVLTSVWALLDELEVSLSHVELLFSNDSDVYSEGWQTMRLIQRTSGLLDGRPPAQRLIEAVVAERETRGAGINLLLDVEPRYLDQLEILTTRGSGPHSFDPSDDANVAQWATELHRLAGQRAHAYSRAAHAYIEAYRAT